jgi:L-rhamnose-H+ transport protein
MLWILVAVAAGVIQGSFTLPMKYTGKWKWENTWGMWSVWALLILPWAIAYATVPHLADVFRSVSPASLASAFAIGLCWGIGAITFGMGVHYVGIALGFAIIMGLSVALGSLIPLFMQPEKVLSSAGLLIIGGVALMMVGIAVGARAGLLKDKAMARSAKGVTSPEDKPMLKGLIICVVAGACGALINIALVVGAPIQAAAERMALNVGADPTFAPNAIWCISLSGGFIVNFGYCGWLMRTNGTWRCFRAEKGGINWVHTAAMGLMWMGTFAIYGICTAKTGKLGPSIVFPLFIGMAVITGNLWGLLTGEWKGSGSKPLQQMALSVFILLAGMGVIGWSNALSAG